MKHRPSIVASLPVGLLALSLAFSGCKGNFDVNAASGADDEDPYTRPGDDPTEKPGEGEGGEQPSTDPTEIPQPMTAPTPLRRLSNEELDRTLTDLFGTELTPLADLGSAASEGSYENDVTGLTVLAPVLTDLTGAMESAATTVTESDQIEATMGCEVETEDGAPNDACVDQFFEQLLPRAYRRPATDEEVAEVRKIYDLAISEEYSPREAVGFGIQRVLLSPDFLYRVEASTGEVADGDEERKMLDDYEVASRLSYFLWGTMPDEDLMAAADAGELQTAEQVEAAARRMLRGPDGEPDPRAAHIVRRLYSQWLGLDSMAEVAKNEDDYPDWEETLRPALIAETERFFDEILWEGDIADLVTADYSYLNERLAQHYGIDGVEGEELRKVELQGEPRQGFLTHGSLLAKTGGYGESSPIQRGTYVLRRVMCEPLADPPDDVIDTLPEAMEGQTFRERYEEIGNNESCAACHSRIHGIGFGFMNYDQVGQWIDTHEDGSAVDATSEVVSLDGAAYDGAVELTSLLGDSGVVEQCLIRNLYRFANGRSEVSLDEPHIAELVESSTAAGGRFEEILLALVRSETFRSRAKVQE